MFNVLYGDAERNIGLLNHLLLGPVPMQLGGIKTERIQKGGEAVLDMSKGFVDRKVLAQILLALEPNILRGILLRRIGRKQYTGHLPVLLRQAGILAPKELLEFGPPMIARAIPQEE